MRILIVDDEPLICDVLKASIETTSTSHKVSSASNGLEALHILSEKDFDLVFMDIRMPGLDGLTATKFLRKCEQGKHHSLTEHQELAQALHSRRKGTRIPVVALTANISDRNIVIQAGMDEFIPKPYNLNMVFDVIDQFSGKSEEILQKEKRGQPRFTIKEDTILVCDGHIGEVVDISISGSALKYAAHERIPNEWSATLINKTKNISVSDIPLKLVRKSEADPLSSDDKTQTIGAMFYNLDTNKQDYIKQFISSSS